MILIIREWIKRTRKKFLLSMHKKAKEIVQRLKKNGYVAYFAGGWVRDYLLGMKSDDIDIATNATPDIIRSLFKHTIPIGEAFGIILVIEDHHQYEVATFRKDLAYVDGRRPTGVEFSTALEDAKRRDFTVNGMFYDPVEEKVIDYVNGQEDLKKKLIRAIGDPHERIKEDRLRMLRAIRISTRFDFEIEHATEIAIKDHAKELFPFVAIERIWQEFCKMDKYKNLKKGLILLFDYGILQTIFPWLENLDKKDIEERLFYLDLFPDIFTIAKIIDLFSSYSLEQKVELCKYLKLSNEEIFFIQSLHQIDHLLKNKYSDYDLAHAYSNPFSTQIIKIIAAHKNLEEKQLFLKFHLEKEQVLSSYVHRIITKDPVLKSELLIKEGIKPSPLMGTLLKIAEKISIDQKIEDAHILIQILKESDLWPKK